MCPLVLIGLSKDVCRPAGTLVVQKTLTGMERLSLFARKEILISGRPTAAKCWETFWRSLQISFSPPPQTLGSVQCSLTNVFLVFFVFCCFIFTLLSSPCKLTSTTTHGCPDARLSFTSKMASVPPFKIYFWLTFLSFSNIFDFIYLIEFFAAVPQEEGWPRGHQGLLVLGPSPFNWVDLRSVFVFVYVFVFIGDPDLFVTICSKADIKDWTPPPLTYLWIWCYSIFQISKMINDCITHRFL